MQCLTYGDFQTLNENEITLKQIINTSDDNETGCALNVDLKCPDNTEDKIRHVTLCPENKTANNDNFTEYTNEYMPNPNASWKKNNLWSDW